MQGHHALYCAAPAHATGRLRTAGSGARGRRHLLAALLMACGHAKTAVLVHGFHLRAPNWETVGGRRRRPRRLRVRFGNYPREISGRRGGRLHTDFRTGQSGGGGPVRGGLGRVDGRGDGRDRGCRHLTTPVEGNSRASSDALISDAVVLDDALNTREEPSAPSCAARVACAVWKSTSASGAILAPSSGEDRHRHAIEQASHRWRGGRRDDSERAVKF